jgi:3-oxoacid CoA-transferase subunit A
MIFGHKENTMAILFSGDFHANAVNELSAITKTALLALYGRSVFDAIRYQIILGDGGFLWLGNQQTDAYNFKILSQRPFPVLCVIGNHEPMLGMIDDLEEVDIGIGERVYRISENPFVAYLKRGKVYAIDGFKFLVLGGALSVDKDSRIPGISWWENEYWTEDEKEELFKLLRKDSSFDFVLAHTGPNSINKKVFQHDALSMDKFFDKVADLNDTVDDMISYRQWWCGHWHRDKYYYNEHKKRGYQYLYYDTMVLDELGIKMNWKGNI